MMNIIVTLCPNVIHKAHMEHWIYKNFQEAG